MLNRRTFFKSSSLGIGSAALASLLTNDAQASAGLRELAAYAAVGSLLLNLDETVTKE